MSASGKSSHRLSEYNRGYFAGTGNGPYALAGMEDRRRHDELAATEPSGRPENPGPFTWGSDDDDSREIR
jgi:hypothetical protein